MDHQFDEYTPTARATPVDVTATDEDEDETPPESRASPSFSFHEERRLLKSDEYWLAHKIPRLPPAALSTSPSASIAALDGLSLSRYDYNDDKTDGGDDPNPRRQSTLLTPTEDGDPSAVPRQRVEMDQDETLELEEERRERKLEGMAAGGLPADQFDTGESPRLPHIRMYRRRLAAIGNHMLDGAGASSIASSAPVEGGGVPSRGDHWARP